LADYSVDAGDFYIYKEETRIQRMDRKKDSFEHTYTPTDTYTHTNKHRDIYSALLSY